MGVFIYGTKQKRKKPRGLPYTTAVKFSGALEFPNQLQLATAHSTQ
jgi:hypothetical protein